MYFVFHHHRSIDDVIIDRSSSMMSSSIEISEYQNMTVFLDSFPQADVFYSKFDVPIPGVTTRDCLWLRLKIQPDCMPDRFCGKSFDDHSSS